MVEPATDYNIVVDVGSIQPMADGLYSSSYEEKDAVVYEMSIRDFTFAANSAFPLLTRKISTLLSGAYLNKGQNENKGVVTGIDHLKELGVTHIQLPFTILRLALQKML